MSGKVNFDTLLTFLTKSLYVENSHAFLCFTCILKGNTLNDKLKFPRFGVTLKYRETRVEGTSHICIDKKKEKKKHIQGVVLTKQSVKPAILGKNSL